MDTTQTKDTENLICVGEIAAPHGVKGGLRVRSFTSPPARLFSYALLDAQGAPVVLVQRGGDARPDMFVGEIKGVTSREGADKVRGAKLYVIRTALPETDDDEYYLSDLVGLEAQTDKGESAGRVIAVHDFGAGTILEIKPRRGAGMMLPFTDQFVPHVDTANGKLTIIMPIEVMGEPGRGDDQGDAVESSDV